MWILRQQQAVVQSHWTGIFIINTFFFQKAVSIQRPGIINCQPCVSLNSKTHFIKTHWDVWVWTRIFLHNEKILVALVNETQFTRKRSKFLVRGGGAVRGHIRRTDTIYIDCCLLDSPPQRNKMMSHLHRKQETADRRVPGEESGCLIKWSSCSLYWWKERTCAHSGISYEIQDTTFNNKNILITIILLKRHAVKEDVVGFERKRSLDALTSSHMCLRVIYYEDAKASIHIVNISGDQSYP